MKFLCIDCDAQMSYQERRQPGDGTFAAAFTCPSCGRRIAMLANPMETQLVSSLGVQIGGRVLDEQPAFVRGMVKRIYTDYAVERAITDITPDVMDRARTDLGLEEM